MGQINFTKTATPKDAPIGKLGLFFNNANELQAIDEAGNIFTITGAAPTTFSGLTDTPANYTGEGGKVVAVNSGEDGVEFIELADVAVSGDYNDLDNTPTIPSDVGDLTDNGNLLFSGDYNDLDNAPSLDFVESVTGDGVDNTDSANPVLSHFYDFEPSTGNISFAPLDGKPRKYGFTTAVTGNITFTTVGGVENIMVKIRHNSGTAPTFSVLEGGIDLVFEGGEYEESVNNYIYAILHKNDAGTVTAISYNISQNQI